MIVNMAVDPENSKSGMAKWSGDDCYSLKFSAPNDETTDNSTKKEVVVFMTKEQLKDFERSLQRFLLFDGRF